ncbi:hypothetical protein IL308_11135 [Lactococcus lactis]|uniref:hypothetical protein n=1 Tax=Lactococcus lactis TaxID=1358 RepID=UPI00191318AD|nr:hypothetical protein [Lactococcus lactis]MBK5077308.1 hypothetical protein [Lactococcus lactis]
MNEKQEAKNIFILSILGSILAKLSFLILMSKFNLIFFLAVLLMNTLSDSILSIFGYKYYHRQRIRPIKKQFEETSEPMKVVTKGRFSPNALVIATQKSPKKDLNTRIRKD